METVSSLRHLFAYNDWANEKIVFNLLATTAPSDKAVCVLAHLLITESEYLLRLKGRDSTGFNFWQELSLARCERLARKNRAAHRRLFDDLTERDLVLVAHYTNSKGVAYQNTYREMLTHVVFHSAYHRGQIASHTRSAGVEPAYTDYVAYVREIGSK